jgi:hypothetical protein
VHRLVNTSLADRRSSVSKQLRGTFDLLLVVTDAEDPTIAYTDIVAALESLSAMDQA